MTWQCLDWDVMLNHLAKNDGVCDIAVAGIDIHTNEVYRGIVFTWPTYRNGLKIMTSVTKPLDYGIWAFFSAFEWQVWVLTAATMLLIPFVIYLVEKIAYPTPPPGVDPVSMTLSTYFWESVGRPMWMRGQFATSWAANIIILGYSFLIMILFALYIGYATSNMTTTFLDSQISSVSDLPGKAVGTWSGYAAQLQKYGIAPSSYPWNDQADEEAMINELKNGTIQALVLDGTLLDYVAATDCDVTVIGSSFDQYEQATAFPKGFNNVVLLNAYNDALANLTDAGVVEELQGQALLPADAPCTSTDSGNIVYSVTFHQVAGLWVILAIAVGFALIMIGFHIIHVRYTKPVVTGQMSKLKSKVQTMGSKRGATTIA